MARQAYLLFPLSRRRYAIPLAAIEGVCGADTIRRVPGVSRQVRGLAHWRGVLLTVIDLPAVVGDPPRGGRPCLLRLAAPHNGLALFLRADTSVGHLPAPPEARRSVEWRGHSHRLIRAEELVARACASED